MNDCEREQRAIWKLNQVGYCVRKHAGRYLVTTSESVTELSDLGKPAAFADQTYADHWIGRKITPNA